jgi:hypothetical protein
MRKILVIAQNEQKAKEAAAKFPGYQVRLVYPGTTRFPHHFDAVIIYLQEAKEINFIKDILAKY